MKRSVDGIASLGLLLIGLAGGLPACSSSDGGSPAPDASPGAGLDGSTAKDATAADGGAGDAAPPDSSIADSSAPDAPRDATSSDGSIGDATAADSSSGDGAAGDGSSAEGSAADAGVADATVDGATGDAAAEDAATTAAPGLVNARTVPVTAATPLAVASGATLPASGATGVPVDTLLRIGFDAPPVLGAAGTISVHQASDGSIVDTIDLADPYAIYDGTPGG